MEALPPLGPPDFPVPPEARTKDAAGAEAFLRYFIDLIDRQRAVPAGQPLRDLAPECYDCHRIANNYDEAAAAGRRYVGGDFVITAVAPAVIQGNEASVSFILGQDAVDLLDAAGNPAVPGQDSAPKLSSGVGLIWSEPQRGWLVRNMTIG